MSRRVDELLEKMTLEEQVLLLAGRNIWETEPVERLGIPRMRVSDGPAGVRGPRFDGPPSMNVPCAASLAASWDRGLVREIGALLGRENRAKGSSVHLAPTVNLHRTPVGGRNFECFSEDPHLSAETAVAYVEGVQGEGVASCIKHFVGNDTEFERMTIDSVIDERTLREAYLVPFERAVRDAGVMAVMSSYNRLNGTAASENAPLLQGVLRGDWGFDGCVISDWYGVYSTAASVSAGCDLEMPGPSVHRGEKLLAALANGEIEPAEVAERARNVLLLMERTGALDTTPAPPATRDDPHDTALIRRASAAGMVLLKNSAGVLPLVPGSTGRVAVIGPNAANATVMGGGSATVNVSYVSEPLDAIRERLGGVMVEHAQGCRINKTLPALDSRLAAGATVDFFPAAGELDDPRAVPVKSAEVTQFRMFYFRDPLGRVGSRNGFGARYRIPFTPDVTGEWELGLESVADARVIVDGNVVLDNTGMASGGSFFGTGKAEARCTLSLEAGRAQVITVELRHEPTGAGLGGLNLGMQAPLAADAFETAVSLAASCDLSIVVVGTNSDWESEGWDREDILLPGEQDRLVAEVARVSPRTVVVVNSGSPVAMPWLGEVDAVVCAWFAGQEMGHALVDILTGEVEPSGRLPVTFPARLADTPAAAHHPGRDGRAVYAEGRLIGYRWYDRTGTAPLFPFGFGLGYADIAITQAAAADPHAVEVTLENRSGRVGVEVVQVYARRAERGGLPVDEPEKVLAGYARVEVPAGGSVKQRVAVSPDVMRSWDPDARAWTHWSGEIELCVGRNSREITHRVRVT